MTAEEAEAIRVIRERCKADPVFWAKKYVYTRDEHDQQNPKKQLPDIPYMWWLLNEWHTGPKLQYVAKSRQLMVSWLLSIYALWTVIHRPLSTVLFQSKKEEDAAKMIYMKSPLFSRASFVFCSLPAWLQGCFQADGSWEPITDLQSFFSNNASKGSMTFPNGAIVQAIPQGASQVESWVPTLFLNDEASLQDEWASAQAAAQPAIDGDARGITVGTMRLPSDYGTEISISDMCDHNAVMKGVGKFKTPSGVYGVRVHYSADPSKDPDTTEGWEWKMRQLNSGAYHGGEAGWRWQQHMEINPRARSGELVLPPMADEDLVARIVCRDMSPDFVRDQRFALFSGFDWGSRNETVWLIRAISPLGMSYLLDELSIPAQDAGGIPGIAGIMKASPYFEMLNGAIQADPSMWNKDQSAEGGMTSKAKLFEEEGVFMQPAKAKGQHADDVTIDRLLNYYWDGWGTDDFYPLLRICEGCTRTLETWPSLRYEEWSDALKHQKAPKETMRDLGVDQWDAFKYQEVDHPSIPEYSAPAPRGSLAWYKAQADFRTGMQSKRGGELFQGASQNRRNRMI